MRPGIVLSAILSAVVLTGGVAHAATEPDPIQILSTKPCDTITSSDRALAAELAPRMTSKMRNQLHPDRIACARMVVQAVKNRGFVLRAGVIAIATVIVESSLQNYTSVEDHTSLGLFQQQDSWGSVEERTDPTWATYAFLRKMVKEFPDGIWQHTPIGEVCWRVQVPDPRYNDRYAYEVDDATTLVTALWEDARRIPDVSGDGYADVLAVKSDGSLNYFANNFNVSANAPYGNSRQIGSGWADMKHTALGDVNGDTFADILAAKPDGTLRYYGNNFNASPTAPYGSGYQIGSGWADMKHFAAADINSDGYADILAVDQAGNLRYYGNNFKVSPNAPYGSGYQIGSGWADMKHLAAADINSDGYADILAVDQAGNLRYYGNNFKVSPNAPYGSGYQIGSGWADMKHFAAADVNGDTFADILAAKPDGTLRYYGNNFNASPTAPYGNGYQIGSGWNAVTHIL
ncbi:VCBS repeat-containing protein [Nonomuraea sp. NPDC046802]|uniref:VCBS repeat-containing protein n=1 Tax=Nonomuraea sp. NPDC046802 TaxID=3154919 RepID=UPI0033E3DF2F